jgi:hypothetical protein
VTIVSTSDFRKIGLRVVEDGYKNYKSDLASLNSQITSGVSHTRVDYRFYLQDLFACAITRSAEADNYGKDPKIAMFVLWPVARYDVIDGHPGRWYLLRADQRH